MRAFTPHNFSGEPPFENGTLTMISNILITGANAGLGKESARQLALTSGVEKIYLGCRNPTKAEAAKVELEASTGKSIFEVVIMDVSSPKSVREAVAKIAGPLDAVILNAGGMGGPSSSELTEDGVTQIFAVNVLGHTVLVNELLKIGKTLKVVMYAGSEAARGIKKMRMKRPDLKTSSAEEFASVADGSFFDSKDPMVTYGPVKYMGAMWMSAMARKHPATRFVTMSPGGTTGTAAADQMPGPMKYMMKWMVMPMMRAFGAMHGLETGAKRYVDALTNDAYASGHFYASPDNKMSGKLVDQSTIFADLGNKAFQDNAAEAIHRFV